MSDNLNSSENISLDLFDQIRKFFHDRTGNWLGEEKRYLVLHRLASLVGPKRVYQSYEELYNIIQKDPYGSDANRVINKLTTHYSFFFREPEHFSFFQRYLLNSAPKDDEIRVWSGACSTGEELYSLAISTQLCLPESFSRVKLLGTDISRESVDKAKQGLFSKSIVKSTLMQPLIDEFFIEQKDTLQVKESIREMARFAQLNLLTPLPFKKNFHIIFLRNIFYYLNPENRRQLLEGVLPFLEHRGFLVMGNMDSAPTEGLKLKSVSSSIYRKT